MQGYTQLNTVDIKSWTEVYMDVASIWKYFRRTSFKIKSTTGVLWAEVWRRKNGLTNFQIHRFAGQLRPTNTVARRPFRAIPGHRANGVVKACHLTRQGWFLKSHRIFSETTHMRILKAISNFYATKKCIVRNLHSEKIKCLNVGRDEGAFSRLADEVT